MMNMIMIIYFMFVVQSMMIMKLGHEGYLA